VFQRETLDIYTSAVAADWVMMIIVRRRRQHERRRLIVSRVRSSQCSSVCGAWPRPGQLGSTVSSIKCCCCCCCCYRDCRQSLGRSLTTSLMHARRASRFTVRPVTAHHSSSLHLRDPLPPLSLPSFLPSSSSSPSRASSAPRRRLLLGTNAPDQLTGSTSEAPTTLILAVSN